VSTHLRGPRYDYSRRWALTEKQQLTVCGRPANHCELAPDGKLPTCKTCLVRGGKELEGRA
jgi:hypothetical protein